MIHLSLTKTPFVSIILAIRNEEAHISNCLKALIAQDYPIDCMEILIADGMSTDDTRKLILGETSSMSILNVLREFPDLMIRGFTRRIWLQYFVLDFSLGSLCATTGIFLSLFGFLWGAGAWLRSFLTNIPATTGTVMLAVLPFILGFQLLMH